jgi:hypothetical protein
MQSTADIGVGSIADKCHAVAMTLRGCESLAAVESHASRILGALDQLAERIALVRRRGSVPMPVQPALRWLDEVVRSHPALDSDAGEVLRAELRAAVARLRLLAGGR